MFNVFAQTCVFAWKDVWSMNECHTASESLALIPRRLGTRVHQLERPSWKRLLQIRISDYIFPTSEMESTGIINYFQVHF